MRLKCDGLWVVDRVTWRCGVVGNLTVLLCPIDERAPQPACRIQAFLESPPILLRKMEAMVEELARKTEDMALQKLAYEHEAEGGMAVGRRGSWNALGSSGFRAASLWWIFLFTRPKHGWASRTKLASMVRCRMDSFPLVLDHSGCAAIFFRLKFNLHLHWWALCAAAAAGSGVGEESRSCTQLMNGKTVLIADGAIVTSIYPIIAVIILIIFIGLLLVLVLCLKDSLPREVVLRSMRGSWPNPDATATQEIWRRKKGSGLEDLLMLPMDGKCMKHEIETWEMWKMVPQLMFPESQAASKLKAP